MNASESTRLTAMETGQPAVSDDLSVFLARHHAAVVVLAGPRKGSELPLHRPRVTIGRGGDCDLVFVDETVSRQHASIAFRSGCFVIEDLESSNGTFVDGERVAVRELEHGVRIKLGAVELQVIIEVREPTPQTHVIDVD